MRPEPTTKGLGFGMEVWFCFPIKVCNAIDGPTRGLLTPTIYGVCGMVYHWVYHLSGPLNVHCLYNHHFPFRTAILGGFIPPFIMRQAATKHVTKRFRRLNSWRFKLNSWTQSDIEPTPGSTMLVNDQLGSFLTVGHFPKWL